MYLGENWRWVPPERGGTDYRCFEKMQLLVSSMQLQAVRITRSEKMHARNIFPTDWGQPISLYTISNNGFYSKLYFTTNRLENTDSVWHVGKRHICKQNPYNFHYIYLPKNIRCWNSLPQLHNLLHFSTNLPSLTFYGPPPRLRGSAIHIFLVNCLSGPRIERHIS